jgi:hypothetical protein
MLGKDVPRLPRELVIDISRYVMISDIDNRWKIAIYIQGLAAKFASRLCRGVVQGRERFLKPRHRAMLLRVIYGGDNLSDYALTTEGIKLYKEVLKERLNEWASLLSKIVSKHYVGGDKDFWGINPVRHSYEFSGVQCSMVRLGTASWISNRGNSDYRPFTNSVMDGYPATDIIDTDSDYE